MTKVSIIVPVYNAEEYLDRSIKSLMKQTLKDIEIILINDGSQDNGLAICKKYADKDDRIKVIDKINAGVSSARNKGIEEANGQYVAFMDPDDYVELEMYKNMYETITKSESDLCICGHIQEYKKYSKEKEIYTKRRLITKEEIRLDVIPGLIGEKSLDLNKSNTFPRSVWSYLYKKEVIDKHGISFQEGLPIGEDFLFNLKFLNNISKIAVDKGCYYHYFINDESAMQQYRHNWWLVHKLLIESIEGELKKTNQIKDLKCRLNYMKVIYFIGAIVNESHNENYNKYKNKIKRLKEISKENIVTDALEDITLNDLSIVRRVWGQLIKSKQITVLYWYYRFRR